MVVMQVLVRELLQVTNGLVPEEEVLVEQEVIKYQTLQEVLEV
jgi:hypothetical protein